MDCGTSLDARRSAMSPRPYIFTSDLRAAPPENTQGVTNCIVTITIGMKTRGGVTRRPVQWDVSGWGFWHSRVRRTLSASRSTTWMARCAGHSA